MKIVLTESQLKNLIESFYDNYGFIDSSFDDRESKYTVLSTEDVYALVKKKDGKETYIVYVEETPYDYSQGYYQWVRDHYDEDVDDDDYDGNYYREFEDDVSLNYEGIELFTEDMLLEEGFTTDVNDINYNVLLITPENKEDVYVKFEDLIKAYLNPSRDELDQHRGKP